MLEKIINSIKNITRPLLFAGALAAASLGCVPDEGYDGPLIEEGSETSLAEEKYNTIAYVEDNNGYAYDFTRFGLENCFIPPYFGVPFYSREGIGKLVVTTQDDSGFYHLFWFTEIDQIDRLSGNRVRVYFNDESDFEGNWIAGETPKNYYGFRDIRGTHATGMIQEDEAEVPKSIHIDNINFLDLDTTEIEQDFDEYYASIFDEIYYPKEVELHDGRTYSTDIGYIIDCCGHWWSNGHHIRLTDSCTFFKDNVTSLISKTAYLDDIDEIEFTGEFGPGYFAQCRGIIVTYKDGAQDKGYLNLTAESYSGHCNHSSRFIQWDKILLHNEHGAMMIPLDDVKKIILPSS